MEQFNDAVLRTAAIVPRRREAAESELSDDEVPLVHDAESSTSEESESSKFVSFK